MEVLVGETKNPKNPKNIILYAERYLQMDTFQRRSSIGGSAYGIPRYLKKVTFL